MQLHSLNPVCQESPPEGTSRRRRVLGGILVRRERWTLSWGGRLLALGILGGVLLVLARTVHPFLAVTARVQTDVLVVEGWIHENAARGAAAEFKTGGYPRVFVTGGPVTGSGGYTTVYDTLAHVGAGYLKAAGVPNELIQMVPAREMGRDRTYNDALALRTWFAENGMLVRQINVLTGDAHARRTRLLFQKAFGSSATVGIISVPNPDYDARHWWRYSEGVREVVGESIAYLYARLFFWPGEPGVGKRGA